MTEQQERDHSAREHYQGVIKSYENEIIELKHLNHNLSERLKFKTLEADYKDSQIAFHKIKEEPVDIRLHFALGFIVGIVVTLITIYIVS